MGGAAKKSTKKFEKNHLKDTIEKRKEVAKIKQRQQTKAKKQARNAADKAKAPELVEAEETAKARANGAKTGPDLSKMSVDEFFQCGFDIPEEKPKETKAKSKEVISKNGKRKRDAGDDGSDLDLMNGEGFEASDDEISSGEEDGLEMHKGDLDALAEKDPEFYKYLKENDAELLDFDDEKDFAEVDELSEEEAPKKKGKKAKRDEEEQEDVADESSEVTLAMVSKWKTAMLEQHSLRAMRQAVLAFRAASYVNSDDGKAHKYTITSPDVYHALLVTALEHVPAVLIHHLPPKELPSGKIRIATDSKKFRSLSPLLKSFSASVHHLLETLSDSPTIQVTLNALQPLIPYLLSFRKEVQNLTTLVVSIWSSTTATSSELTLMTAFLLIQRLFTLADSTLRTAILKIVYLHLIKASRTTNTHTLPTINMLKNTSAKLWGLDSTVGYTTGFTHIRQLAIHLRSTITKPTKESYKTIYNWQYVHSLDFWSRVLSLHCSPASTPHLKKPTDSPLHPLIYPLVQITLGALRLIPTPAFFPLRFHLTRSLLRISRTTNTYIPLAPSLLEVLNSPSLTKPPKASTLPPLDFTTTLKAPQSYLRTRTYQDGTGQQTQELLAEFFACWAKSIAFPDLIVPPTVALKRWLKTTSSFSGKKSNQQHAPAKKGAAAVAGGGAGGNKNAKLHSAFTLLLQKLAAHATYIEAQRAKVTFAPGMRHEVEGFLREVAVEDTPLGAYVKGMEMQRREREEVLARARREEGRSKRDEVDKVEDEEEEEEEELDDEDVEMD